MAKVYSLPESLPAPPKFGRDTRVDEYHAAVAAREEEISKWCRERSPKDKLAGKVIRFQVADGYASYVVTSSKPVAVAHLGDEYHAHPALLRGLRAKDIKEQIEREEKFAALFANRG